MTFTWLNVQVLRRCRVVVAGAMMASTLTLQSCAWYPGMVAAYGKQAEVKESPEDPVNVDYDLVKVTPLLVKELVEQTNASERAIKGPGPLPQANSYPYKIGPQDVLRIFVWGNPDLTPVTTNVTSSSIGTTPAGRVVDTSGNIYFPFVGEIRAAGMTVSEFRARLSKSLSRFIKDPQVEVDVANFRSQRVFVSGEVRTPGVVPVTDQPLRITDAIGQSGGATPNSDLYDVVLTRNKTSVRVNLDRLYYHGDLDANVLLQHGDVISVPDRSFRKVYVLGEVGNSSGVNQARSYMMRRGRMSLTEMLADAGGLSPFSSSANQVYLMRLNSVGKPVVYLLDASDPQALLMADQFPVQPRDLIFVNPTTPTMIGRFIGQFLPIISTANTVGNSPF